MTETLKSLPIRVSSSQVGCAIAADSRRYAPSVPRRPILVRRIPRHHFALLRGHLDGIALSVLAERYLDAGERSQVQRILAEVRRNLRGILDVDGVGRKARGLVPRVSRVTPKRQDVRPSLKDFAAAYDPDCALGERELVWAYQDAYPPAAADARPTPKRDGPREVLYWLERRAAREPKPADRLREWVVRPVAERLEAAGMITVEDLRERMARARPGCRWWLSVPGVGDATGRRLEAGVLRQAWSTQNPRLSAAAVVPLERAAPPNLSWHADCELLNDWIHSCGVERRGGRLSAHTRRAYLRQAERLILWAWFERKMSLSSLRHDDCRAFDEFLASPPASWCASRGEARSSLRWRPLEGPLSATSRRQARTILSAWFDWGVARERLQVNPWQPHTRL